jgi:hypothetical protein
MNELRVVCSHVTPASVCVCVGGGGGGPEAEHTSYASTPPIICQVKRRAVHIQRKLTLYTPSCSPQCV